ncbi:MAG: sugar ABC transporter permease [Clostridiales bacterium]|jgi:ABC-type sugar transport system permease subunit|nr:sugar ABC transporter permease [Clostridiales bacterium]
MRARKLGGLKSSKRKRLIFYICLLAYPLAHYAVFYIGVNINSVLLAFKKFDGGEFSFLEASNFFANFSNFSGDLFKTSLLKYAAKNSLLMYGVSLLIVLPLNLMFSFFLYKKIPLKGFYRIVLFLPQIVSSIVMAMMFKYFVERGLPGLFSKFNIELPTLLTDVKTAFSTIIAYNIWAGFGTQIIIYSGAMSRISEELVESGKLDGMNMFQEFIRITLPLIYPTVSLFLVAGVAGIFTSQAALYNFFGDEAQANVSTLGYFLFVRVIGKSSTFNDYPYAAAAGLLFTAAALPITLGAKYLLDRFDPMRDAI